MISFLLHRPIAVFMTILALVLLGLVAILRIPISLMPDISIPEITVHVNYPNNTAREIETKVIRPLRNQLSQISNLNDIKSESRDGSAIIILEYQYGTDTDFAFIETNEKIDAALSFLPQDIDRPRAIKASTTDIPVLNLTVSLKEDYSDSRFLELSEFVETVLVKRIEQLPQVALADISGQTQAEISITPNNQLTQSLGINLITIANAVQQNNFEQGNLIVQNGNYQYNFKFSNSLRTKKDIEDVYVSSENRLVQIKDIATVKVQPQQDLGLVYNNSKRALVLAVIKQANARTYELKTSLEKLITSFESDYPELDFQINQDQTSILKMSIDNLKLSLLIGSVLAILIMFLFSKDIKSSLIIAISIPISLIMSILIMFGLGLSINIISLSGLIFGVGLMIDNSIIVIDNINQKLVAGVNLIEACITGTNEIISPLFSSVLTTCSVFVPLIFLRGITGALFYDQAMAVSIGLGSSLLVSILIIPVVFNQIKSKRVLWEKRFDLNLEKLKIEDLYEKGYNYFNERKYIVYITSIGFMILALILFIQLEYEKLPQINQTEAILTLDWNENINVEENHRRILNIFHGYPNLEIYYAEVGIQQFLLKRDNLQSFSESKVYFKLKTVEDLSKFKSLIGVYLSKSYPNAKFRFDPPKNLFEYVFGNEKAHLLAKISNSNSLEVPNEREFSEIRNTMGPKNKSYVTLQNTSAIEILHDNLLLYGVDYYQLINELKTIFNQNLIDDLKANKKFFPIKLNYEKSEINRNIYELNITNKNGEAIPLRHLIRVNKVLNYKSIHADRSGEYLGFELTPEKTEELTVTDIRESFKEKSVLNVRFAGSYYDLKDLNRELLWVALVSLLLLYFIMSAQFESFWQPLIILTEIPIDIGGGLLLLWLFGGTINVMSAMGIVIMSGIIINDSILKLHTINLLRKKGLVTEDAIKQSGKLRLKPILMTSLTTILALSPFLFASGLGSELQKPLALTVIGGMIIGVFISLYFIPFIYKLLHNWLD